MELRVLRSVGQNTNNFFATKRLGHLVKLVEINDRIHGFGIRIAQGQMLRLVVRLYAIGKYFEHFSLLHVLRFPLQKNILSYI